MAQLNLSAPLQGRGSSERLSIDPLLALSRNAAAGQGNPLAGIFQALAGPSYGQQVQALGHNYGPEDLGPAAQQGLSGTLGVAKALAPAGAMFTGLLGNLPQTGGFIGKDALAGTLGMAKHYADAYGPPAEAGPAPNVNGLLEDYLSGLGGGQGAVPGLGGGEVNTDLPAPPHLQAPDFSKTWETLNSIKPPDSVPDLPSHTYPGALSEQEQADLVSGAGWEGAAKAGLNHTGGGIGELILAAGLGGLAGRQGEKRELKKSEATRQEKQLELTVHTEEKNADRQDKVMHDRLTWGAEVAGLQRDEAKVLADVGMENLKLQYNHELDQVKERIAAAKEAEPKIISLGKNGIAVVGRDNIPHMYPLETGELAGLNGGSGGDLADLRSSGGDPFLAARMIVRQLGDGRLPLIFSPDMKSKGADLQTIEESINKSPVMMDIRQQGATGEKEWLRRSKAEKEAQLAIILLRTPNLLTKAIDMLKKKPTDTTGKR